MWGRPNEAEFVEIQARTDVKILLWVRLPHKSLTQLEIVETRKDGMKRIYFLFFVLIWVLTCKASRTLGNETSTSEHVAAKPNVLFIAVDDLRPELGCYGNDIVISPNIDRFANSALVFKRAYCQQAVCNPSRTSLMTGLRPDTVGVTGNHIHFRSNKPNVVTLPQHFKSNGYHAAAIGKLYHGVFPDGASNTKWDTMGDPESWSEPAVRFGPRYYYTEEGVEAAKETFKRVYKPVNRVPDDWTKKLVFGPATESPEVSDNTLYDGKVADAAIEKLGELKRKAQPFFLAVGFIKPHSPYIAPKKYFDLYEDVGTAREQDLPIGAPSFAGHGSGELRRYTDQPRKGPISKENQARVRHAYYACVSFIDAQIGRVLDELELLDLSNNTIVCLYGDHGYHLGEHGLWGKTTNFELDTRVPLIIRSPGMKSAGKTTTSLVELVDIYPTLAELAGVPLNDELEGKSFVSILDDPSRKLKEFALSQYPRSGGLMGYSMRTSTHRLTQWVHRQSGEIRATELYEYADSLIERENVIGKKTNVKLLVKLRDQFNRVFEASLASTTASTVPQAQTRVACVGDSITFGAGIKDRVNNSYPSLLQKMLGKQYQVRNFGFNGATLLKKGHKPYWEEKPYSESLEFHPDVVVINLGANDAVDMNWKHGSEFPGDYKALIESYRKLPSNPKIYLCEILPIFSNHVRYKECMANRRPMSKLVREVATVESAELINLHSPFVGRNELFPDGIHPNEDGALVMASKIFSALTGENPPRVQISKPPRFADENGTSFEAEKAGRFTELETNVGTWNTVKGEVLVDNKHAKSGKQCLQLAGGEEASVELAIADRIKTNGLLSFWAERWTSRAPFSFRIEKLSGETWSEIYNGDTEVLVGRAFLSQVQISLGDSRISKLRFSVTSPVNTGVLIDDLRIAPAKPMTVKSVEVVPFALPALVGAKQSALVKLKVTSEGILNPISITSISASLIGDSSAVSIENWQPFFSIGDSNFRWNESFGTARTPRQGLAHKFVGKQALLEGENYIWLACILKNNADIDKTIAARINSITFSNGETENIDDASFVQRLGVSVRNSRDDGVHTYRIPGLATSNKGTLIGVYDVRRDGGGDLPGNIDVGMSRSIDGGRTWKSMKVIMDMGKDPKWRGDGIGDPSVIVDRKTGTIWVSATWSHGNRSWFGSGPGIKPDVTGQWILVKSDDDGVTWSDPINITRQVKKPEWCFLLQGPGKGITMSDGTLVLPAQYQDPPNKNDKTSNRLPHSTFIYSRDSGVTWKVATGAWDDTTESQIVELADGELMLNCRNNRASKRAIMTTIDMGQTWKEHPTHVSSLIEPGSCMASLINVGRELGWRDIRSEFDNEFLLFSNPDSLRGRHHMTIKASKDSGATWPAATQLLLDEQRGAGYSCMTMIDEETVGILYEGSQAHMTFQRVKIKDILNPPKDQKTKNPAFAESGGMGFQPVVRAQEPKKTAIAHPMFARPFTDHMVLQCEQEIRIWGRAKPQSAVEVTLDSSIKKNAITDGSGNWIVELPPQQASFEPTTLTAKSENGQTTISDVLIGEVWICAGQSNMEFELRKSSSSIEALDSADDNYLRLHNCPGGARGNSGVYNRKQMAKLWPEDFSNGVWEVASRESAAKYSAVGYFFARQIREKLNRPVGIINVAVGGTPIESWVSKDRVLGNASLAKMYDGNWLQNGMLDDWCKKRASTNLKRGLAGEIGVPGDEFGPNHSFKPGFMHEAGIKPFAPLSVRGGLWYQGESNADNLARTKIYDACFPLLVEDWRANFQNSAMPVVFVQLPGMGRPSWPLFREYQRRSLAKIKNVGMAIAIDTGDPKNVHPALKKPVGDRLAQWALASVYNHNIVPMGPLPKKQIESNEQKIIVEFDHVGDGLKTNDGKSPRHFEVAGADLVFRQANARIVSETKVELTNADLENPRWVRYAWRPFLDPSVNLVNSVGLPASPFSSFDSEAFLEQNKQVPTTATVQESNFQKSNHPTEKKLISKQVLGKPNVLLIISEDNGPELGCYGDPFAITPNLDRLAQQGVRFKTAYVTQSVCSPSRGSILTGLYPHQNGQIGLATHQFAMFKEWPTTYSLLKKAGYRTGMIGKLHVNPEETVEKWIDFRAIKGANFGKKNLGDYAKNQPSLWVSRINHFF